MKIGQIVGLTFLDHAQYSGHSAGPMLIEVFGRVVEDKPLYVNIACWVTKDRAHAHNDECFSILKSTIIKKKILR